MAAERERERAFKLWQLTTIGCREGKWQIVIGYKGEGEVNGNERLSGEADCNSVDVCKEIDSRLNLCSKLHFEKVQQSKAASCLSQP